MDIKSFLRRYIDAKKYAEMCAREYESLREVWIKSPRLDGMPRGSNTKGLDSQVAVLDAAERRFDREREKALKILDEIETLIEGLDDYTQKRLVRYRYIEGLSWVQISQEMHFSERSVYYIHGKALNGLRRLYDDTR